VGFQTNVHGITGQLKKWLRMQSYGYLRRSPGARPRACEVNIFKAPSPQGFDGRRECRGCVPLLPPATSDQAVRN
jgi:hypothetical protein